MKRNKVCNEGKRNNHKVYSQIMFIIRHCIILNISFNNIIILECDICKNYFTVMLFSMMQVYFK